MPEVTVVTDSTAGLPRALLREHGIELVSLYYGFENGEVSREVDLDDFAGFYEQLRTTELLPTTWPPSVEDFIAVYGPLLDQGSEIVSIHISSGISETCSNARLAAKRLATDGRGGERIQVLDSSSTGAQLALVVLAASRAVAKGKDAAEVADVVRQARLEGRIWVLFDTLEFLRRGGRIGSAAAWIGSTLNIKPILTVESEMRAVERVRTRERGIERLVEYARQLHAGGSGVWAVQHTAGLEDAQALAERLSDVFHRPPEFVGEIGPVLGVHAGPGLLGIGGIPTRFLE